MLRKPGVLMKVPGIILIIILLMGGGLYLYLGYYDISAVRPHFKITLEVLDEVRERSIAFHSKDVKQPFVIDQAMLLQTGRKRLLESCRFCHGAPGFQREPFADGLYPNPPYLGSKDVQSMNDKEIFWVAKNGIKMTGMPAFAKRLTDEDLWGIVKAIRALPASNAEAQKQAREQVSKAAAVVELTDEFKYVPGRLQIKKDSTLEWRNVSQVVHTVTADPTRAVNAKDVELPKTAKPFDSGDILPGQSFKYTFEVPGKYRYFCVPHEIFGMVGEIEVTP